MIAEPAREEQSTLISNKTRDNKLPQIGWIVQEPEKTWPSKRMQPANKTKDRDNTNRGKEHQTKDMK